MVAFFNFGSIENRVFFKMESVLTIAGVFTWGGVLNSNPNIHHDRDSVRKRLGGERSEIQSVLQVRISDQAATGRFLKDAESL